MLHNVFSKTLDATYQGLIDWSQRNTCGEKCMAGVSVIRFQLKGGHMCLGEWPHLKGKLCKGNFDPSLNTIFLKNVRWKNSRKDAWLRPSPQSFHPSHPPQSFSACSLLLPPLPALGLQGAALSSFQDKLQAKTNSKRLSLTAQLGKLYIKLRPKVFKS